MCKQFLSNAADLGITILKETNSAVAQRFTNIILIVMEKDSPNKSTSRASPISTILCTLRIKGRCHDFCNWEKIILKDVFEVLYTSRMERKDINRVHFLGSSELLNLISHRALNPTILAPALVHKLPSPWLAQSWRCATNHCHLFLSGREQWHFHYLGMS